MTENDIKSLILTVRGKQVLLDSDVARLYGYEKRAINQAASRNKERFPPEFRFQLTACEIDEILKSQIVISRFYDAASDDLNFKETEIRSKSQNVILNDVENAENSLKSQIMNSNLPDDISHGGRRKLPYVYTEQGIGMLSGLLKNKTAVQVSIGIMNAFVEMRQFLNTNKDIFAKLVTIDNKILEHDQRFDEVFDLLQSPDNTPKQGIFYKGQFYDAYKLVVEILVKAQVSIIVIDNYLDDSIFDLLAKKNAGVVVTLITGNPGKVSKRCRERFSRQYGAVSVVECKEFHDRFIVLDNAEVYAFGASFKDLGNKCFEVSKNEATDRFVSYVKEAIKQE